MQIVDLMLMINQGLIRVIKYKRLFRTLAVTKSVTLINNTNITSIHIKTNK